MLSEKISTLLKKHSGKQTDKHSMFQFMSHSIKSMSKLVLDIWKILKLDFGKLKDMPKDVLMSLTTSA